MNRAGINCKERDVAHNNWNIKDPYDFEYPGICRKGKTENNNAVEAVDAKEFWVSYIGLLGRWFVFYNEGFTWMVDVVQLKWGLLKFHRI